MTIRIKFETKDAVVATNGLSIDIELDGNCAWAQNETAGTTDENANIDDARTDNDPAHNVPFHNLKKLKITGTEQEINKIKNLLDLKADLAGTSPFEFMIENYNYKVDTDTCYANITDSGTGDLDTLNLNITDFGGLDNLDIGNIIFTNDAEATYDANGDFSYGKDLLINLEDRINKISDEYKNNDNLNYDSSADKTFFEDYINGGDTTWEKAICDATINGKAGFYREEINKLLITFKEFDVWKSPEIGFTTVSQVLRANANNFIIAQRGGNINTVTIGEEGAGGFNGLTPNVGDKHLSTTANLDAIKATLRGGKYRKCNISGPAQTIRKSKTKTTDEKNIIGLSAASIYPVDSKEGIDRLQNFININKGSDSENIVDKKKSFGFAIGDILTGNYVNNITGGNHGPAAGITKICYDIWMAPSLDEAIDLAFFGIKYTDMGNPDDSLLSFNELEGKSELEMLDIYLNHGLKDNGCGVSSVSGTDWFNNTDDTGNYTNGNQAAKDKVDNAYNAVKPFVTILDKYNKNQYTATTDKTEITTTINTLEKLQTDAAATPPTFFAKRIVDKWGTKIGEMITKLQQIKNGAPDNLSKAIKTAKDAENDNDVKTIYDHAKITTEGILNKVKSLISLVIKGGAATVADNTTLKALNKYTKGTVSDEDKIVWEIVNSVKDSWAQKAIDNLLNKDREAAKSELKTAIKNDTGNKIYKLIIAEIENEEPEVIRDAKLIYVSAEQAWKESKDNKDLRGKLEGFSRKDKAWKAVNKHKHSDGKEFAKGALDHLKNFKGGDDKEIEKVILSKTLAEWVINNAEVIKSDKYKTDAEFKKTYDEKVQPRSKASAIIREKAETKSAELSNLIIDLINVKSDYADKTNEENKTELEGKLADLEKFTTAGTEENNLYGKLDTTSKGVITKLVSEVKSWIAEMKAEEREIPEGEKIEDGWKPWQKLTTGGVVLAILALVVYFLKRNTNEEGE